MIRIGNTTRGHPSQARRGSRKRRLPLLVILLLALILSFSPLADLGPWATPSAHAGGAQGTGRADHNPLTGSPAARAASAAAARGGLESNPPALQLFYLTLPEDTMLQYFYDNFSGGNPASPMRSVTSIAIGTNGTLVYYDQWEDGGYDADIANPEGNYYDPATNPDGTQIWGDGVVANGCPPYINNSPNPCTLPEHDTLNRGHVMTLDNRVIVQGSPGSYSRNPAQIYFDGRDKVGTSLPVAITRSMWPSGIGSLVADAQSVLPTERWGAQYVSPVGENNNNQGGSTSGSFRDVRLLIMAGPGGATINVDANADGDFVDTYDRSNYAMTEGQVISVNDPAATINGPDGVKAGALVDVVAGNPVQVTLITSDYNSNYENRFYNLIARGDWVSDYYSPVGTPTGGTQCTSNFIYNPNAASIEVNYDFAGGLSPDGTLTIGAGTALEMPSVPAGSGARFYTTGGQVFLPLSMTDCPRGNDGNIYDWGNELYPVDKLSPELLIGWAPGCSDESYQGVCLDATNTNRTTSRSVVWLTPLANTTIYVDTNGSGISCPGGVGAEETINATALSSYQVNDDPTSRAYVHDNFGSQSYGRATDNQGFAGATPVNWSTSWTESGDNGLPGSGMIWITGGVLQFRDNGGTNETNIAIARSHNMAGQPYSRLSFRIQFAGTYNADDAIAVEISPDGVTWTTLETIAGPISFATGQLANRVYRTSVFNSASTTISFRTMGNLETGDTWSIDEVHIDYTPDGDFDMTGAYIRTCDDVLLAAAFGQDPPRSFSGDDEAMDLGMGIPPYGSQIRIQKSASAPFVCPGDLVTYTYAVRLIQTFSTQVNNVEVVDDFCSPTFYVSGDANGNTMLDPSETWIFQCTTQLYADTTNTALAYAYYGAERIRSGPDQATVGLTSSVGDYVWVDEDGDGDQDAGEPGLPNARVTLSGTDLSGNPVSLETRTDANGRYLFTDVPPSNAGGYTITVDSATLPAGLAANPTYDEDGVGTPHTTVVVLGSGVEYTTADFGYNWASTSETNSNTGLGMIGDRVWSDANGDGRQDPGEPGLYNVTVELLTAGPDGIFGSADDVVVATTTTDYAGNYAFDGLAADAYVVRIPNPPSGYTLTGDPDQPGQACTACDGRTTTPIVLAPGDVHLNADFGYRPNDTTGATIGDTLWVDTNRDNAPDAGEPRLAGVTVSLIRDMNGNGVWDAGEPIIASTITSADGEYLFTGVPVADGVGTDDYLVWVNDTANVLGELRPTYDSDGATTPNISAVSNLTPAGNLNQDFAYAPPGHAAGEALVGDTIWLDQNGNGVYDPGEGLEGVTVNLLDAGGQIIARTLTSENGQYFFGGLAAGTYTVDISTNSLPNYGIGLTNFSDPDGGQPHRATLTLASGEINLNQDFGYRNTSGYTIGGTIWNDTDADGLLEGGESGRYAGVSVALYTDSNDNGVWDAEDRLVGTTTADANGDYAFTGLPNDRYFVDVTDDAQVLLGNWKSTGATPGADNNSQVDYYTIVLSGANNTTADFGYYRDPARIGDFVWDDYDRDGIQDPGEPGIAGVTVQLTIAWPGGGGSTTLTTVTDASGYYSFGNLLLDEDFDGVGTGEPTFSITFSTPTTYELTTPNAGGDDTKDSDYTGVPLSVTVTEGQYNDTIDCGFRNTYLTITKTSDANAAVNAGDAIQYTIVVANNTPVLHTGIAVTDPLPAGTTYSTGSVTGYKYYEYRDNFDTGGGYSQSAGASDWSAYAWTENGDDNSPTGGTIQIFTGGELRMLNPTGDSIQRSIPGDLTDQTVTLEIDYRETGTWEAGDCLYVEVRDMSANWQNLTPTRCDDFNDPPMETYDISTYANAATAIRIRSSADGSGAGDETVFVDCVRIYYSANVVGQTIHTPPNIILASDGFALNPGQSMQITYQVIVNDPVALFSIDNTASVVSTQQPTPRSASVSDPVNRLAAIGDRVWLDEDSDGVQDAGEAGIPNATVTLSGVDILGNAINRTTVTDSEGRYLFDVPAGSYTVSVDPNTLPAGLAANPTYDEDGLGTPHTSAVTVGIGEEHVTADFGYNWASIAEVNGNTGTGAIGDHVWIDADGDGRQDPGEAGLGGVTATLYHDPDGDGVLDTPYTVGGYDPVGTTDAAGNYIFDNLPVGVYAVGIGTLPGYAQTGDPDQPGATCTACDNRTTTPVLLGPGDVYVNADFGLQPTGLSNTIGNLIFLDANGDGNWDTGEPGIPGVTVALLDGSGRVIATTATDASGAYSFPGLPDGTYTVWVNDTAHVLGELRQNSTPDNNNDGGQPCGTCNGRNTVTVSGGAGNLFQDFGYAPAGHGSGEGLIGDTVFLDRDADGQYDPGEGIEGVVVRLYQDSNSDGNYDAGEPLVAATTTDENGHYFFGNLPAGDYVVRVDTATLRAGLSNTVDPDGGVANESGLTLGAGNMVNLAQDFGYRAPANPNTISGTIWNDTNADGLLSGESGRFAGVTVVLYDANGNIVATTTTDGSGNYAFTGLPDGTYCVDVTDENNVLDGYWHSVGPNPGVDNNSQADPYTVTVSGGQTNATADFGYYLDPARVGDYVWLDRDNDGVQEADEPGIRGVKVTLTIAYPNGGSATLVAYTDWDGRYSFGNLLLDEDYRLGDSTGGTPTYTITFATPPGAAPSPTGQGTPETDSNGTSAVVDPLYQGQTDITYDSGFYSTLLDLGDLPQGLAGAPDYPTLFRPGPAHLLFPDNNSDMQPDTAADIPAVWLGLIVDTEPNGNPSVDAKGDDSTNSDEDGLAFPSVFSPASTAPVTVTINASESATTVYFGLWVDWDQDGTLEDFYSGSGVSGSPTQVPVVVTVPPTYGVGSPVHFRARAADFPLTASDSTGTCVNGEVEDYRWPIGPTAVKLLSFTATGQPGRVVVAWETATEIDNLGFNLYRRQAGTTDYARLNDTLIPSPAPGQAQGASYTFIDAGAAAGQTYEYVLEDVDMDGTRTSHGPAVATVPFAVFLPLVSR